LSNDEPHPHQAAMRREDGSNGVDEAERNADQASIRGAYRSAGILNVHATASRAVRTPGGTRSQ
jgi:hypothetical protein